MVVSDQKISKKTSKPELSFVIPAYNESENIKELGSRIKASCEKANINNFEVVFVENGSFDDSARIIYEIHEQDPRFKMLQLSRNFGYQGAITAGLKHAGGEWIAMLDGDQQDPPEIILEMLEKGKTGFDVVYGVRKSRQEGLLLRLAYKLFYRFWRWTSDIDIPLDAGDFCVIRRNVLNELNLMPERQRFIRGLRAWVGFKQIGFDYDRDARHGGLSKFSFGSSLSLATDAIFAFSVVPIRITIVTGLVVTCVSICLAAINVIIMLFGMFSDEVVSGLMVKGLTQTNLVLTILLGVVLLSLGVIGEYIGRIYEEVKNRPLYIVKQFLE